MKVVNLDYQHCTRIQQAICYAAKRYRVRWFVTKGGSPHSDNTNRPVNNGQGPFSSFIRSGNLNISWSSDLWGHISPFRTIVPTLNVPRNYRKIFQGRDRISLKSTSSVLDGNIRYFPLFWLESLCQISSQRTCTKTRQGIKALTRSASSLS